MPSNKDAELERRLFDEGEQHTDLEKFAQRRIRELLARIHSSQLALIDAWSSLVWRTLAGFVNEHTDPNSVEGRIFTAMQEAFATGVRFDEPWKCCEIPVTRLVSGGRSSGHESVPPTSEHVGVCDGCGAFTVLATVGDVHVRVRFTLWHPNALIAAGRALESLRNEEPRSPLADLTVKAARAIRTSAEEITTTLESVDTRAGAADGPVTPTLQEITPAELKKIYQASKRIVDLVPKKVMPA